MDAISRVLARMRGQRVYIDANYFIYFLTRHPAGFEDHSFKSTDRMTVLRLKDFGA